METTIGYKVERLVKDSKVAGEFLHKEVKLYGAINEDYSRVVLKGARGFKLHGVRRGADGSVDLAVAGGRYATTFIHIPASDTKKVGVALYEDQEAAATARKARDY